MNKDSGFTKSGTSPTFEQMLSDEDVAKLLSLHVKTLQKMAKRGEIPAIKIGRFWRFRISQLNRWIDEKCGSIPTRQSLTSERTA